MTRSGRIGSALALLFVCIVHLLAAWELPHRGSLDVDETEFLQGAVRMARGERIYVDFAEHHPPFVFQFLARIAPKDLSSRAQLEAWVVRARLISNVFGAIAVAAAGLLLWRTVAALYVPAIFMGVLLASPTLWDRAFSDVRGEPPALALFWLAALLILGAGGSPRRRVTLGAIGVGLVAFSCLINPKWPLASVALGLFFVVAAAREGWPLFARGMVVGAAIVGAAVVVLVVAVDPRQYVDFVFVQSRHMYNWWTLHAPASTEHEGFFHCPMIFWPRYALPAAAFVLAVALTIRDAFRNVRVVYGVVALLVAAFLEIRFVYPYPRLWVQYYILWGIAAAAVYALVPRAAVAVVARIAPRVVAVAQAIPVVLTIVAALMSTGVLPLRAPQPSSIVNAAIAAKLRPGDTVFLGMTHHPLGARDASYYWFGFADFVPGALDFATTPRGARVLPPIREEDLPPCRLERGLEPNLRLITSGPEIWPLKTVSACIDRLRARGMLVPVGRDVLMVQRLQ